MSRWVVSATLRLLYFLRNYRGKYWMENCFDSGSGADLDVVEWRILTRDQGIELQSSSRYSVDVLPTKADICFMYRKFKRVFDVWFSISVMSAIGTKSTWWKLDKTYVVYWFQRKLLQISVFLNSRPTSVNAVNISAHMIEVNYKFPQTKVRRS
jgi:hypothetical protein